MISPAQPRASSGPAGRHVKMRARLGVSETPVTFCGPRIARSRRCGRLVKPYELAMLVLASDQSCGEITSWTGPSNCGTKTADTRWGPAVTWIGSVQRLTPFGSETCIQRSRSKSAACSPSIAISICSRRSTVCRAARPLPKSSPVVSWWNETRKRYSPSAGKACVTETPPREPYGAPST